MELIPFKLFCPYQLAWGSDPSGVKLAEKSRRIGWTYFDAFDATINRIGSTPKYNYDAWYSATDMTAAVEYMGYVSEFAAMVQTVAKVWEGEVEFLDDDGNVAKVNVKSATFDNGLRITAGSSNPNFFRSKGGEVKLDELAFHRDGRQMVKAALATARFWGYPLSAWSSHNGPGSYFNSLLKQARDGSLKASVHSVNILQAVEQGIVERIRMRRDRLKEVPAIDFKYRQEWLDERRAECPDEDVWNEEYMCIPSTDAGAFLDYELLAACEVANANLWSVPTAEQPWPRQRELYAGVDVGRKSDLTCVWVIEKLGDVYWTRFLKTMYRAKYSAQEDVINAVMGFGGVRRMCIDETGIGNQMAERMQDKWKSRLERVTFTNAVKADLALPLRGLFQDKRARIPATAEVREDLHAIRKLVTSAGNTRYAADEAAETDGHADRFWALALAYHAGAAKHNDGTLTGSGRKPVGC